MANRQPGRRWRDPRNRELLHQVLARMVAGQPLDDLRLDSHEGRVDLRGLVLPEPSVVGEATVTEEDAGGGRREGFAVTMLGVTGLVELRGVTLTDLDLSGARLEHLRLYDVRLDNCRFDQANCRDWRSWDLVVQGCSFRGANLRDAVLGSWGNDYRETDFRDADLRGATCRGANFTDCDFSGARLDRVEFVGCRMTRVTFADTLEETAFFAAPQQPDPGALEDVSFVDATLRWVTFRGLSLASTRLPADGGEHIVVRHYPRVVRAALARLEGRFDAETRTLRARLQADVSQLDESRDIGVWHRDELGKTEDEQRFARELLHDVERECDG